MAIRSRFIVLFLCLLAGSLAHASVKDSTRLQEKGLRVSILTIGPGQDLYSTFGHSTLRIIDSANGTDIIYGYGNFAFNTPHFYYKFVKGRLLYFMDVVRFNDFLWSYKQQKRTVQEQVLDLPESKKLAIQQYLRTNMQPQNRSYLYNFLSDNCATRVRDVLPDVLGKDFKFGNIISNNKISYRDVINKYTAEKHWERIGIDLLMGRPADKIMSNREAMFVPAFLHKALKSATYKGRPIVTSNQYLLNKSVRTTHRLDGPLWTMIGVFILTLLCFQSRAFQYLKGTIKFLLLFVTGLLGCILLFTWLGTNHPAFKNNFNILWAFPPNLIIAFLAHKKWRVLKYYSIIASALLLISVVFSVFQIQKMPLFELVPLFLSLLYVYVDLWKQPPSFREVMITDKS